MSHPNDPAPSAPDPRPAHRLHAPRHRRCITVSLSPSSVPVVSPTMSDTNIKEPSPPPDIPPLETNIDLSMPNSTMSFLHYEGPPDKLPQDQQPAFWDEFPSLPAPGHDTIVRNRVAPMPALLPPPPLPPEPRAPHLTQLQDVLYQRCPLQDIDAIKELPKHDAHFEGQIDPQQPCLSLNVITTDVLALVHRLANNITSQSRTTYFRRREWTTSQDAITTCLFQDNGSNMQQIMDLMLPTLNSMNHFCEGLTLDNG
jgi:hypothetical protein